jgi:hypothetical protein
VREEEEALATSMVFLVAIYVAYRVGHWLGRKAEQRDLLRIISAQRIITHKEQ